VLGVVSSVVVAPAFGSTAISSGYGFKVNYFAGAGEANSLVVAEDRTDPAALTVSLTESRGIAIDPLGACSQGSSGPPKPTPQASVAVCPLTYGIPDDDEIQIRLFDGNDSLRSTEPFGTSSGAAWNVDGGKGVDVIEGGPGSDTIRGGPGDSHDELNGNRGFDYLSGGGGRDTLFDGEGDNEMLGGPDHDLLRDGTGSSKLYGGTDGDPGRDTIIDRGGNDDVRTGGGNDEIRVRDDRPEQRIWCGPGRDDTAIIDARERDRTRDCEHVVLPR
jgi:Ca2+-binding RTX toxin-like protein